MTVVLMGVMFRDCVLTGCVVRNCDAPGLEIDGDTQMEYSDFVKLVQNPGESEEGETQDGVIMNYSQSRKVENSDRADGDGWEGILLCYDTEGLCSVGQAVCGIFQWKRG